MNIQELLDAFSKLNVDSKRSQVSNLLKETAQIIDALLQQEQISSSIQTIDYKKIQEVKNDPVKEDEVLTMLYSDIWTLRNSLYLLLSVISSLLFYV